MNSKQFQALVELIEDAGFEARAYSGRGMYGQNCLGVTADCNPARVVACILLQALEAADGELNELLTEFQNVHCDSLGMGSIVYFPSIAWVEREEGCG